MNAELDNKIDYAPLDGRAVEWVRERHDEQQVEQWDERTGEMTKLPKKRTSARAQADAMVTTMLWRARSGGTCRSDEMTNKMKESN